ncbi:MULTISPECIES: chemotaxis protein CheW [unclassified Brevundimonas]|uniref:chemotaxis protein CheW n=1 Tax=unclassified Brevundimonas TaxID=2622653 RepID=UPI0025BC68F4|nr:MULTISPECIES: chemotaxis protein CheW [unclassified Brevundimonas]
MNRAAPRPFLTFFVGEAQFAADAATVSEVFRQPRVTRVPGSPYSLLGIAALRGAATPVVSLARLFGGEDTPSEHSRLLLLEAGQTVGLLVDRVGALTQLSASEAPKSNAAFGRLYAVEDAAARVVDLEGLLRQAFSLGTGEVRARTVASLPFEEASGADRAMTLLAFELAGQTYALPLEAVSEVLTFRGKLTRVAGSEDMTRGVLDLRGRLLPVVSLKILLGLAERGDDADRVIVTRVGDAYVGLAVDGLKSILRVAENAVDPAPAVLNRGKGEAQVQSIARLPEGQGLVAILSTERLFRDEKTAQILADGRTEARPMDETGTTGAAEAYLIFRIGGDEYGLPLAAVGEVARLPERLTRVPRAPAFVEGVLNLRGRVTPVIDQRRRFQAPTSAALGQPRVIVTTVEARQTGFIVDAVSEILGIAETQMDPAPDFTADAGRLFTRVATLDGGERLILLIEPKALLDRAERDLLADMDISRIGIGS